MKTVLLSVALSVCVLSAGVSMTGCETSQAGVSNVAGTVNSVVGASPDKVAAAAKATLEDLKLASISASSTKVDGKVTAKTAQDRVVTIKIATAGENVSEVDIRVGDFGDEGLSMQILDGIKKRIK
ncbi:MAG: DUF3568 domain-containing protein [Planctomycetes bacterium]|nr:DUF3568 domain-containing protein [Planctomycetota bacterium]